MLEAHGLKTFDDIREFVAEGCCLDTPVRTRDEIYRFVQQMVGRFEYLSRRKAEKGILRRFLSQATGLSSAQITRLLHQYDSTGRLIDHRHAPGRPFPRRYATADIDMLAEVDALHGTLCGPVTRKLCARAYRLFEDVRFERLASISNGHLYNLRRSTAYRRHRGTTFTSPYVAQALAERRRSRRGGKPGHVRIVSIRRAALNGLDGLRYLHLVDDATHFQFVGAVEHLYPNDLTPFVHTLSRSLPFARLNFHADKGASLVALRVAALLQGLSEADPGMTGSPQAASESPRATSPAERFNAFAERVLSPYLNHHRPCFFPAEELDSGGRPHKRYRDADIMTPYEKFRSLPGAAAFLRSGTTLAKLDDIASAMSDNEAARALREAGSALVLTLGVDRTTA